MLLVNYADYRSIARWSEFLVNVFTKFARQYIKKTIVPFELHIVCVCEMQFRDDADHTRPLALVIPKQNSQRHGSAGYNDGVSFAV